MALVYLFETIGTEYQLFNFNGKIHDNLSLDFDKYIILKSGERIVLDDIVDDNDIIYIRRLPEGVGVAVAAVVAVAVAVGVGVFAYKKTKDMMKMQNLLQNNQKAKVNSAGSSAVQQLPWVKGASNQVATGNSFPYIIGDTLFSPYKLCSDHVKITGTDGKDAYRYMVLEAGFAPLRIRALKVGSNTAKTWNDETAQDGIFNFDKGTFFDEENAIEIRQTGALQLEGFEKKILLTEYTEEIPHKYIASSATAEEKEKIETEWKNGLVKQLASNTMSVEVCILFDGLSWFNNNTGYWQNTTVELQIQWTNVENPQESDWVDFDTPFDQNGTRSNTFTRNVKTQLRFLTVQNFSAQQAYGKNISIRIRRLTAEHESNGRETCYLLFVQTTHFDYPKSSENELIPAIPLEENLRDKCTRIGLKIKSTPSTDGLSDKNTLLLTGCCRVWNRDLKKWEENPVPTRNLAAWVLEILTSKVHRPSKYEDNEIDLESFGEWYEYCADNEIYADGAITTQTTKQATIDTLVANGNAALVMNEMTGKIEVYIDNGRDYSIALLTPDNILELTAVKQVKRLADGKKVTYVNRDADFDTDSVIFMRNGGSYNPSRDTLAPESPSYITGYKQAYRYAWRKMAEEIARPLTATVKVGAAGVFYPLFDCVQLQHPALSIALGHGVIKYLHWKANKLESIDLYGTVEFPEETTVCGIVIECIQTGGLKALKVSGSGKTRNLGVLDNVYIEDVVRPYEGDKLSFGILTEDGSFELVSTKMLIVGTEPSDEGAVLSLTEYNEDVYKYGLLPEYKSNITPRPESSLLSLQDVRPYVAPSDITAAIGQLNAGTAEIDVPDTITYLEAIAKKNEISLEWAPLGIGLKNTVQYYEVDYSTDNGETWQNAGISKTNAMSFILDRELFGYPEAADFATWQFRVIAASIYAKRSEEYKTARVNVSQYGTWKLAKPHVYARVNNRAVTMILSQPERADGKEVYGTLNYKVSVKRPDIDTVWYRPATDADPYADEFSYKTEPGYIESSSPYVQYMPLKGQSTENIEDTLYMFRFSAYTEAEESEAVEKTALTTCGEIRDLVKAKETAKEAYITELSTLSANVGTITQGAFGNNNIWDLSTFRDDKGFQHYEGLFHVGGGSQYLHVDPVLVNGHPTGEYTIAFKVGAFEISADASNINGELIIQYNDKSLDRTRITQTGTFYEHRETVDSTWKEIASDTVNGVKTQQVFSEHNLVITNQSVTERRLAGTDIGNPYLSENAKVYHFDENFNDQKGESELLINGSVVLVGNESSGVIDFTPAILAVSPYSTVCKSAYGQFSAVMELAASNIWTVDFWTQYIYAENQILFDIGNDFDKIKMTVQSAEAFYNDLNSPATTEDDNFFYSYETFESQLYTKLLPETLFYNEDVLLYNERDAREPFYNRKSVKEWSDNYIYFRQNQNGLFVPVDVSVWEYDDLVSQELLYEEDCVYNEIEEAQSYISHEGINGKESVSLKDLGIDLKDNMWLHVGIISSEENLTVYMDHISKTFGKYSFSSIKNTIILNAGKTSFILDELYIDNGIAESYEVFCEHTQNRIPWGALDKNNQHFILEYNQNSRLITNIFDSDLFKNKVLELINTNK